MRVAHLLRPAQGGMLRHVRSLLLDPELEALLAAPPAELMALASVLREPGYPLPVGDALSIQLQAGRALGLWARRVGVEYLHGHGLKRLLLYVVAAKVSRRPLVVTLHNLVPPRHHALLGFLLRQCSGVVAVSHAVAKTAPVACQVIHNGISLAPYREPLERLEARAQLGWAPAERIVLCVARLSPEKGVAVLAEAAQGLGTRIRVVVAGEGPERARLEALGGVQLLGERSDIPRLLAAADLYCQPSHQEGLGLALIEAMAAGLPIVASRVGGIPELIDDQETGLLVPAGDALALAEALSRALREPQWAEQLGNSARRRAHTHFSEEQMRMATRALYKEKNLRAS